MLFLVSRRESNLVFYLTPTHFQARYHLFSNNNLLFPVIGFRKWILPDAVAAWCKDVVIWPALEIWSSEMNKRLMRRKPIIHTVGIPLLNANYLLCNTLIYAHTLMYTWTLSNLILALFWRRKLSQTISSGSLDLGWLEKWVSEKMLIVNLKKFVYIFLLSCYQKLGYI